MTPDPEDLVTVSVVGLPIDVQQAAQQHGDELTRELVLVAEQMHQRGDTGGLPARFVELVATLSRSYSSFTAEQERQLAAAIAAGEASIDLRYTVPASVARAAADLGALLDEVDEYCRDGQLLLTLETPPLLVTYRRWFLDQFIDQIAGKPPVSWADYLARTEATAR